MALVYLPNIHRTDGVMYNFCEKLDTRIPILLISRQEEFEFNERIYELENKEYAIVDFIEMGWNVPIEETFVVGKNLSRFKEFEQYEGWQKLERFVANNPPKVYFKRELLSKDVTNTLLPIEYPNFQPPYPIQTKEMFNKRPISALWYWGRSHEARLLLHGKFWESAAKKGYAVCDNIYQYNDFLHYETNPVKFVTLHIPYYARLPITELLKINGDSKLSVSLPGCGNKCFRSTGEAIVNSICIMPEDNLAYSLPFIHGINCIKFPKQSVDGISKEWDVIGSIEEALKRDDLYDIYLKSVMVADFYRVDNYSKHLEKIINE